MKVTEKQLQMMYQILIASLPIMNGVAYSQEEREKLANAILNQQDNENLIDFPSVNKERL